MNNIHYKSLFATLASAAFLSACGGGGGDSSSSPSTPASPAQPTAGLTGKAIDGYLVGAKVCLDVNSNNVCDGGEPSTTTDENGNYGLVVDGYTTAGKKVLVVVTPTTKDKSRPGYVFPAQFTLSAMVDGQTAQHVTPLTTMVGAQMEGGASQFAAYQAVVSLVGGSVNLKDDYIANGDGNTAAFASQVVDKVTELAKSGLSDPDTVRAIMNAIVTKSSVTAVTSADVDAELAKPVYSSDVDAKALLADQPSSYNTLVWDSPTQKSSPGRKRWTLTDQGLQIFREVYDTQAQNWTALTDSHGVGENYGEDYGDYLLKADGTWSGFIPQLKQGTQYNLASVTGNTVTAVDPNTDITYNLEYRRTALGGRSLVDALPVWVDDWTRVKVKGAFAASSDGYLGILSTKLDAVALPVFNFCPTAQTNFPVITEDSYTHCNVLGDATKQYTSVDQVIGVEVPVGGNSRLVLSAGGKAQIVDYVTKQVLLDSSKISWARTGRSFNVLVIKLTLKDLGNVYINDRFNVVLRQGGSLVVALHNGHLKLGELLPGVTGKQAEVQLKTSVFDQLVGALKQAGLF